MIGECLDCTGKTGGFNLQRCWASGAICGKSYQISTSQPQ
ncbi:MAG: NAD(P)/FAD-dependent oxidoreductase [Candidatus Peribacteria bacterium]|nr:NAD(P)/FAD-dependent oxidoreductase [Candidatus Peribacteria bacterium]